LLQSVGIGVTNLLFTFVGLWLIDRLGRRTLLYIGSFGYIASLGACAWAFFTETFSIVPGVHFCLHRRPCSRPGRRDLGVHLRDLSQPAPGQGQSLGSFTHWIFAALLTCSFPRWSRPSLPATCFSSSA
jgi:MFS transporter, SP family, arabinose:H+ symporter